MSEESVFEKLKADPKPVEFEVGGQTVKAWLHALTDSQTLHCFSVFREQYDLCKADGQEEAYAKMISVLALDIQLLRYAVRVGEAKGSDRLFTGRELLTLKPETRQLLLDAYTKNFEFSEAELGESLRARTGTSTPKSSSPANSPVS